MLQMCVNGPICEREGRADAGYSAARQAFAGWDGPGTRWPQFLLGMQAVAAHLQARRPGRASAVLDELERQARKERLGRFPLTRAKLLEWRARIQLSLALGQPRKLPVRPRSTGPLSGARRAINALDKLPTPLAGRAALPLRACLEEQLGDGKAAALTWAQAVAVHTESGQWLHSGLCEIRLAENRKASPRQVQKLMASLQRRGVRTPGALLQAWLPVPDHESP